MSPHFLLRWKDRSVFPQTDDRDVSILHTRQTGKMAEINAYNGNVLIQII